MDYKQNEDKLCRNWSGTNRLIDLSITEDQSVTEPVTLDEVKTHIRVTFADDDAYLTMLIKMARSHVEKYTGLSLVGKTIALYADNSEGDFVLPYGPVKTITTTKNESDESVESVYSGLTFQRLTSPTLSEVRIVYTVGYATVPVDLKLAVLHEIAYLYEHRGDEADKEQISPIAKGYAKMHRRVPNVI